MYYLMAGLVESIIPSGQSFAAEEYVLEMDAFPDMIGRYLKSVEMSSEQRRTQRDGAIGECGPMEFKLPAIQYN